MSVRGKTFRMNIPFEDFIISDDPKLLQIESICAWLGSSYWANARSREAIERSIQNSLCFGVYKDGGQVAFARCVTDYATIYWLADVFVDERFRGLGIGKAMVSAIVAHEKLAGLSGILATRDAQALYEKVGFALVNPNLYMRRPAAQPPVVLSDRRTEA